MNNSDQSLADQVRLLAIKVEALEAKLLNYRYMYEYLSNEMIIHHNVPDDCIDTLLGELHKIDQQLDDRLSQLPCIESNRGKQ